MMTTENTLYSDLNLVKDLVCDKCGFGLTNLKLSSESVGYGACSFELNGRKVEHRTSKITPTKAGQFVTIWKRSENGVTEPFDVSDDIDFVVITSKCGNKLGQFIFPKSVLAGQGIISQNGKGGKRGIRVYPPWDIASNRQAKKTQDWQAQYFLEINSGNSHCLDLARKLLDKPKVKSK